MGSFSILLIALVFIAVYCVTIEKTLIDMIEAVRLSEKSPPEKQKHTVKLLFFSKRLLKKL